MGTISQILGKLFSKKEKRKSKTFLANISPLFGGLMFGSNNAAAEINATFISAVNTNATFLSKISPKYTYKGEEQNSRLNFLLQLKPNPNMNALRFWKIMAKSYFMDNLAVAWIVKDSDGYVSSLYSIDVSDIVQISVDQTTGLQWFKFRFGGSTQVISEDDLIIIQRDASLKDLLCGRSKAIDKSLEVINAAYTAAQRAVLESTYIRFLASSDTMLSDEKRKSAEKEVEDALNQAKNGLAMLPSGINLTPISSGGKWLPDSDVEGYKNDILEYLGCPKSIVQRNFTEDIFQSYEEGTLEPFCLEGQQELTYKLLTKRQIQQGIRIEISTDPIQTASLKTRISIADSMLKLPTIVPNDILRLLHQPTYEGGDEPQSSLNWVSNDLKSKYQLGEDVKQPQQTDEEGGTQNARE